MNNSNQESKKTAAVKCKDSPSPPALIMTVHHDWSHDAVLCNLTPVLVSQTTQDSASPALYSLTTPLLNLSFPQQPILHFTDDGPYSPTSTTADLVAISNMASGS